MKKKMPAWLVAALAALCGTLAFGEDAGAGEITEFSPLNVGEVEQVAGASHSELREVAQASTNYTDAAVAAVKKDVSKSVNEATVAMAAEIKLSASNVTSKLEKEIANSTPGDYANVPNKAMTALQPAATNGLVTASVTNGLASQSSLTSLSSRVDDKRDKTDLAVYGKYVKWYIVETSGDGRLSEPIEMYDHGGYTFSCDKVNVSGDELHPNRIVCDTEYGDDGKVSAVSGSGETWWPGVDGNEPGYTMASVDMDTDAANLINDPANGEFSAFVQYYDADGNVQYGMVRFRVTYTGGPHELADTLAKTSDLTAVSNAIPTAVSGLSDAGDYLKTADLAKKETDPSFNAWTNGNNIVAGYGAEPAHDNPIACSVVIGREARTGDGANCVAIGYEANAYGTKTVAIGANANPQGNESISIGVSSKASGEKGIALGHDATASAYSFAVGSGAAAKGGYAVALGYGTTATWGSVAIGVHRDRTGYVAASATNRTSVAFAYYPNEFWLGSYKDSTDARTLQSYLDERATTNALAAVKASIPAISATDATFSNAVDAAARALVKSKLESLDKAKSSIGETIAALQSIYNETETK